MSAILPPRVRPQYPWDALDIVREFHRASDGFIGYAIKPPSGFQSLTAHRVDSVLRIAQKTSWRDYPERWMGTLLLNDGYFTINAFWAHGDRKRRNASSGRLVRTQGYLKYVNAVYVDVDFEQVNLSWEQAMCGLERLVRKGRIPPYSMIIDSGGGFWVVWLLGSETDPDLPEKADPTHYKETFARWQRLQERVNKRLRHLGADPCAKDGSRLMRYPGSINSRANRRVGFEVMYPDPQHRISYTMREMEQALGITKMLKSKRRAARPKNVPGAVSIVKSRARRSLYEWRLRMFKRLETLRGGFRQGTREQGAWLYVTWMKILGFPDHEIEKEVEEFGARCHPPLDRNICVGKIKASRKLKMRDSTIVSWLRMTPAECSTLGFPREKRAAAINQTAVRISNRRDICRELIKRYGTLSCRTLVQRYAERGIRVSVDTAASDLRSQSRSVSP